MRWFGRTTLSREMFVEALNKGKRGLYISPEVVAMSAKCYWRIMEELHKKRSPTWIIYDDLEDSPDE